MPVQPALEFIPPDFNPIIWRIARTIIPAWLRYGYGISEVRSQNTEELVELYRQFQAGKTKFLIAFRHPATTDPPCIAQLLWNQLPQIARKEGKPLQSPVQAHFIYDRGIPLWAGEFVGWLLPKLGSTSIRRGTTDRQGLRSIRNLFVNGRFPLAAAPEGATNGHNEIVSPLEPGIAQFAFWCQEDLRKADRTEDVAIVPLGIRYRFVKPPWKSLERLLAQLEVDSGLKKQLATGMQLNDGVAPTPEQEAILYKRLYELGEHLLSQMEEFYSKFYQQDLVSNSEDTKLATRLPALLDAALNVAEKAFNLKSKGNLGDRCRRVEQAGWDRIYRLDMSELKTLAPVERGLANLVASEAELRLWHMRLVESFVSVTGQYVAEKPTVERFADTILLLWKTVSRMTEKSKVQTPRLGKRWAQLTVEKPFFISDYWDVYQTNRRQTVANLTQDLKIALEKAIATEEN
ncbi:1-acyl-sn-glycerol-3-phosphate acyltransferase [Myxosarcina sp. GI1]|uniref:1-acyl-sn-glycerol-3-phosphate acyltransferase n=1 Tax=Myxosarcina sp. GI1 TaxID=1541065 RepID=UPI000561FB08|nr:1-acyl-sn-glycerol-3-phosphate acyltransferase [Myxosarcina sp. GI1]